MADEQVFNMEKEFEGLDFNSSRLESRFIKTMETLSKHPDKSIWFCSGNRAEAKAIYRMLGNESVDREEILRVHKEETIKRILSENKTILAIQDTTSLNYNTHKKTDGIGYVSNKILGVNIHTCLAVTTDGLVLGVLEQMSYNRPQVKDDSQSHDKKKARALEEKESFRWVNTFRTGVLSIPKSVKVITVCDREGDMYELFDEIGSTGHIFLIRIAQNRITKDNEKIKDAIKGRDCIAKVEVTIPRDSRRGLKARNAILQIRYDNFEIKRPEILSKNEKLKESQNVNVIYVKEECPPDGVDSIEWLLMSNDVFGSVEEVLERVNYYIQRWKIERFHYVLKSGCCVEKLQERSIEKTTLLVLMYSIIAVSIMNLTYIARLHPELPCSIFFDEDEWRLLYCVSNKTKNAPLKPYGIGEAVKYIGYLGGPKRSPSDGPPGVKTIWIGLDKLNTLLAYREWII